MAQTSLPAPRLAAPRRRAFFGLFDADGWGWASAKAAFWFVLIIILLGYLPDRAYYFTVQRTVDLGLLAWSPVNFCPPGNETLPCPAPHGATVPWHPAPPELQLPAGRTDGAAVALGQVYLYLGGSDGSTASDAVFVSRAVGEGNIDKWSDGPALPEPRVDAAAVTVGSTVYLLGGADASGAPTSTVFSLTIANDGTIGEWQTEDAIALPEPRTGASAVSVSDGIVVMGGSGDDGAPTDSVWKSQQDAQGALQPWTAQAYSLYEENVDGIGMHVGDAIFLIGGRNASGAVATVQIASVGGEAADASDPNAITHPWRVSDQTNMPGPRTNLTGFVSAGTLYVLAGSDGSQPRPELIWSTPEADGTLETWKHLDQTDLGQGIEGTSAFAAGSHAFIVGGTTADGVTSGLARANLAPQAPFFQLGVAGVVVPALKIDGEIGQQLGYLNAAGVGTVNFVLLLLVGWAFAHKERVRALVARFRSRRR